QSSSYPSISPHRFFFSLNATAPTAIYTLSLHDALPILLTVIIGALVLLLWIPLRQKPGLGTVLNVLLIGPAADLGLAFIPQQHEDRKSTRLNSSHVKISYAVFCLKKKKKKNKKHKQRTR